MSHSHDSEPEFEKLSKAITEAVMTSEKVRKIVEEIQKKDEICPQSFMVLVLKMQVLTESLEMKIEQDNSVEKPVTKNEVGRRPLKGHNLSMDANFPSVKSISKSSSTNDSMQRIGLRRTVLYFKPVSFFLTVTVLMVTCAPAAKPDSYRIAREQMVRKRYQRSWNSRSCDTRCNAQSSKTPVCRT